MNIEAPWKTALRVRLVVVRRRKKAPRSTGLGVFRQNDMDEGEGECGAGTVIPFITSLCQSPLHFHFSCPLRNNLMFSHFCPPLSPPSISLIFVLPLTHSILSISDACREQKGRKKHCFARPEREISGRTLGGVEGDRGLGGDAGSINSQSVLLSSTLLVQNGTLWREEHTSPSV